MKCWSNVTSTAATTIHVNVFDVFRLFVLHCTAQAAYMTRLYLSKERRLPNLLSDMVHLKFDVWYSNQQQGNALL